MEPLREVPAESPWTTLAEAASSEPAARHPHAEPCAPGEHESWRELAGHAATHDQLSTEVPDPGAYARFTAWRRRELGLAAP